MSVFLNQLQRYETAGIGVVGDAVGQLAGFGEYAAGRLGGGGGLAPEDCRIDGAMAKKAAVPVAVSGFAV